MVHGPLDCRFQNGYRAQQRGGSRGAADVQTGGGVRGRGVLAGRNGAVTPGAAGGFQDTERQGDVDHASGGLVRETHDPAAPDRDGARPRGAVRPSGGDDGGGLRRAELGGVGLVEIGQLEAFLVAVRLHNFSKAAGEIGVTQPSLSARILALEAEFGISLSPAHRRVRAMEDAGIITGYRAVVEPSAVGLGFAAVIFVTLAKTDSESVAAFEKAVPRLPEVVQAVRLFGDPDFMLHVVTVDLPAFQQFYDERLSADYDCSLACLSKRYGESGDSLGHTSRRAHLGS